VKRRFLQIRRFIYSSNSNLHKKVGAQFTARDPHTFIALMKGPYLALFYMEIQDLYNHIPSQILNQNLDSLDSWYPENVTKGHATFVNFTQDTSNRGGRKGFFSSPEMSRRPLGPRETPIAWVPLRLPWGQSGWGVKLIAYLHLVLRLRMRGGYTSSPPFTFMMCTGITLPCFALQILFCRRKCLCLADL
jgi:hypothetical protein